MNFFEHQRKARKRTTLLVFFYGLAVLGMIGAVYALVISLIVMGAGEEYADQLGHRGFIDPGILLIVIGGVSMLVLGGSFFKVAQLASGGGRAVAEMMGGRRILPTTSDPAERRLYNVVEEMAVASGVPIPAVYVMDQEHGINAFAAGFSPQEAAVAVNRGTMELLTRDELQGVIGHEFSHILNGDMRLNLRLIGILFGLQLLALVGYYVMRVTYYASFSQNRRDDDNKGAPLGLILYLGSLGLVVIGYVGVFFSSIIKAAISRQREFLADASAVQFTRNPAGIAGALKKIGCPNVGSEVRNEHAAEASHLFFGNVCQMFSLGNLLATHPDLTTRIRAIEPTFDGRFPTHIEPINFQEDLRDRQRNRQGGQTPGPRIPGLDIPGTDLSHGSGTHGETIVGGTIAGTILSGLAETPTDSQAIRDVQARKSEEKRLRPLDNRTTIDRLGEIDTAKTRAAAELLQRIPANIVEAAREPLTAKAAFYAILLDDDTTVRLTQIKVLTDRETEFVLAETASIYAVLQTLPVQVRIPLAQQISATLSLMTHAQYRDFSSTVDALIDADRKMSLLEYTIKALLLRNLDVRFGLARPIGVRYKSLPSVRPQIVGVLSFLAYSGQETVDEARSAYEASMKQLGLSDPILPDGDCSVVLFDQALRVLAELEPGLKQRFFDALMTCVKHDGQITIKEGELIRAVAAMLAIPMPNF